MRQFKDPHTLLSDIENVESRLNGAIHRRRFSIADGVVIVVLVIWLLLALVAGIAVFYQ